MKDYNNFCNNCGRQGHLFHQCKNPVTSIGIIVFSKNSDNQLEYLMITKTYKQTIQTLVDVIQSSGNV